MTGTMMEKKDVFDDYNEYSFYRDTKHTQQKGKHTNGNRSTVEAIICIVLGMLITGLLFSNVDLEDIPGVLVAIVWIVISVILAAIINVCKHLK